MIEEYNHLLEQGNNNLNNIKTVSSDANLNLNKLREDILSLNNDLDALEKERIQRTSIIGEMKVQEMDLTRKIQDLELQFEEKSGVYNDIWKSRNSKERSLMLINERLEDKLDQSKKQIQSLTEKLRKYEEPSHNSQRNDSGRLTRKTSRGYDYD
ncbi:hypothetical protein [Vibrio mexicanus]|uniref:hypothetical protein n=1 Tax=Vibrio mexicanus TaxID=1004326 RepID=UPI00069A9F85|nr:hypothetical protein [Vibrio mexicanus]